MRSKRVCIQITYNKENLPISYTSTSGFNMGNDLAIFVTYGAMLVDGNLVTNLLSIGGKTPRTGPTPPQPAIVGGLDTHAVFEGMRLSLSLTYIYVCDIPYPSR